MVMPPRLRFNRGPLGGRIQRPHPQGGSAVVQPSQQSNPRAAAPAKPDAFNTSGRVITTESMALGGSVNQGQMFNLPIVGDIVGLHFTLSASSATGSGSVTVDWANAIEHITLANRNGNVFDTYPVADRGGAGGLNPSVYDFDTAFIKPTPTSVRSNTTAASTVLTGLTKTITLPGIRCAAVDGPWQLQVFYNSTTGFAGTGVTAATISNRIRVMFGNAFGYNSKIAYQLIPTTGAGDYHLETTGIVKNTLINQLFLTNMSTLTNLDHVVVNSHGLNIDTSLFEAEIVQAMTDNYYNAFNAKTLVPTAGSPAINTQFTIGDSDELILNFGTTLSNVVPVYQYLLPAGDAY